MAILVEGSTVRIQESEARRQKPEARRQNDKTPLLSRFRLLASQVDLSCGQVRTAAFLSLHTKEKAGNQKPKDFDYSDF